MVLELLLAGACSVSIPLLPSVSLTSEHLVIFMMHGPRLSSVTGLWVVVLAQAVRWTQLANAGDRAASVLAEWVQLI